MFFERLLNKETEAHADIKMTRRKAHAQRAKIAKEMYLCKECGHLYYYRIIKCPLCESNDTEMVQAPKIKVLLGRSPRY
ncbi:MAG: hypothetical protein HY517_00650 [Candidatus Aenigmarchaeota archaeon]|nr:hypothetical protein [Candidatus Aenigmarchaeota archaeon]